MSDLNIEEKPRKHLAFLVCFGPHCCSYMTGSGTNYKQCRQRALAHCISVLCDMGDYESRLYKCLSMKRVPEFDGKPFPYSMDDRRAMEFISK